MQTNSSAPSAEQPIGKHRVRILAPDVILAAWHGDIDTEEARDVNALIKSRAQGPQSVFFIQDVRLLGSIPIRTRRMLAADSGMVLFRHITVIGASFKIRILYDMIFKALRALGAIQCDMSFVSTETEALRLIEEVRKQSAPH